MWMETPREQRSLATDTSVGLLAARRFWNIKVWDTKEKGNLLCHIVPVYSDHAHDFGLYDIVNDRFLPFHSTLKPPAGYRQLDYVDTDGSTWVNTLFRPTCTNAVEIRASIADPSKTQFLYCSRRATSGSGRRQHSLAIVNSGGARFDYGNRVWSGDYFCPVADTPYVFTADPAEDADQEEVAETSKTWALTGKVGGVIASTFSGCPYFTPDATAYFCLFGSYAGTLDDSTEVGNLSKCRFYRFKVWDTKDRHNLLCHIVPVFGETEQAVGLYDLVAGRFLPAHGGTFTSRYVLTEDEDWSYSRMTLFPTNVTVDLNGHNLAVATVLAATNEQSAANADYQDLAYITANGAQAVKITGFQLPGTAKVEMKVRVSKAALTQGLFMSRAGTSTDTYTCSVYGENSPDQVGKLRFDFNNRQKESSTVLTYETDHELVFDGTVGSTKSSWSVDGITQPENPGLNNFTGGDDLRLFTMGVNGNYLSAHCRLYYFTVSTNGVVLLDLRPARRISDGVIGLHDRVGNVFYESFTSPFIDPEDFASKFTNSSETASELRVGQELIPGYTVVECITSTNRGTRIDTGYVPQSTDRLEMRASIKIEGDDNTDFFFCSRVAARDRTFTVLHAGNTHKLRFDFKTAQWTSNYVIENNTPITVALDGNVGACYVNGEALDMGNVKFYNDFTPYANLWLFAKHDNGANINNQPTGNIYWFKAVGADGTVKVDMVPVVRDMDGMAGLYDRARRQFYPSASTITFAAGSKAGDGKLYVDVDGALNGTEITGNVTLVKKGEGAFDGGGMSLASTLKPEAGTVGGVTLSDGATLDLSDRADAFSLDDNAISFANGAHITIALGSREVSSKEPIISWTTAPSNVGTLTFMNDADGGRLRVKEDGVYPTPNGMVIIFR